MPLIDTWAWLEYFAGSKRESLRHLVEGPGVATSILSIGELADVYARDGSPGLEDRIRFIKSRGSLLTVTEPILRRAAVTKWTQRRNGKGLGLIDAVIYETARDHGLEVVTGDPGFEGLPGVQII
jgi:predicted nucleic acid-binding protein